MEGADENVYVKSFEFSYIVTDCFLRIAGILTKEILLQLKDLIYVYETVISIRPFLGFKWEQSSLLNKVLKKNNKSFKRRSELFTFCLVGPQFNGNYEADLKLSFFFNYRMY